MDWRVLMGTTVVAVVLPGAVACGDGEDDQEECTFCVEEGAPDSDLEQRILTICEDVCDQEIECFGEPPGGREGCVDECNEAALNEVAELGEECLEAEIEVAECYVELSCDELLGGGMWCEEEIQNAEQVCDYGSPRPPEP